MPNKIKMTVSPGSEPVTPEEHSRMVKLLPKIDAMLREAGFDSYLLTVHAPKPTSLYSTTVGTLDSDQATALLSDALRSVQELIKYTNPTAPGGFA